MNQLRHNHPPASTPVAAAAIGSMSVLLAVGLGLLGVLDRMEKGLAAAISRDGGEHFTKAAPAWAVWLAAALAAYGVAFSLLHVTGLWRRLVVWITTLALVAGWAPVLVLASRPPAIGAPLVAVLWAGICALFYAASYRLPANGAQTEISSDEAS